jgi:hypothetical protein
MLGALVTRERELELVDARSGAKPAAPQHARHGADVLAAYCRRAERQDPATAGGLFPGSPDSTHLALPEVNASLSAN